MTAKKTMKKGKTKKELEKELNEKHQLLETYTNDLKRLQADFENFVKRAEKEKSIFIDYEKQELILRLLMIIDDFEQAIKHMHNTEDKKELIKGIEMIHSRLLKFLEEHEVKPLNALGEKFDPYKHDIVEKVNGKEDIILEEVQKGYSYKDKILRPTKVKVGGKGGKKNE